MGHRTHEVVAPDVIRPLWPQPHARAVNNWPVRSVDQVRIQGLRLNWQYRRLALAEISVSDQIRYSDWYETTSFFSNIPLVFVRRKGGN
jgi:hypothetical protein